MRCGQPQTDLFFDDLEDTASGNWALQSSVGSQRLVLPAEAEPYGYDATYATSGTTNFWGYDRCTTGDSSIAMADSVSLPAGAYLWFAHAFNFTPTASRAAAPPSTAACSSTAPTLAPAGTTQQPVHRQRLQRHHRDYFGNPLGGRSAFSAKSQGYISSRLSLHPGRPGRPLPLPDRYRRGTWDYGWFVDDIRIYTCGTTDTSPPDTTITAGPTGTTNDSTPTFSFDSTETGSTFECRIDGDAFATCTSPHTTAALTDGAHTFEVRATDTAGNTDPTPASRDFTVDTAATEHHDHRRPHGHDQ